MDEEKQKWVDKAIGQVQGASFFWFFALVVFLVLGISVAAVGGFREDTNTLGMALVVIAMPLWALYLISIPIQFQPYKLYEFMYPYLKGRAPKILFWIFALFMPIVFLVRIIIGIISGIWWLINYVLTEAFKPVLWKLQPLTGFFR